MEAKRRSVETRVAEEQMGTDRIPALLVGLMSLCDLNLLCTSRKVGFLAM